MPSTVQSWRRFLAPLLWLSVSPFLCNAAEPLKLSMQEAIRLALLPAGQAKLQLAAEAERVAESQLREVRSATALHLDADVSDRVLRFDLRSIGVELPQVSPFVANVELPVIVGPFTVMDAEVRATKSIVNRAAKHQVQAARESVESVKAQSKGLAVEITVQTARAYLDALRAKSETDLAAENVKLSAGGVSLAGERRANGIVTGAEVRRANLNLAAARESLFAAQTAYRSALLQLVALIGIPFDTPVELTDQPVYRPQTTSLGEAIQTAFKSRSELASADLDIETLRLKQQAIASEARPTLAVFANAGELTVAPTPSGDSAVVSSPTYTAGFDFRLPILDGGRRAGERAEIESQIRQASIKRQAMRRQIELQVRLACVSLEAAAQEVDLAQQRASLAAEDSGETRARYAAGEASGVELQESQARMFHSRQDYILAVYQYEAARVALGEATGDIVGIKW